MLIELLLGLALIVVSAVLVGYPLLVRSDGEQQAAFVDDDGEERESHRERVFTALNDIEFDYRTHKLSGEDYQELRAELASEAVSILKEEEEEAKIRSRLEESLIDEELEREIQAELEKRLAAETSNPKCPHCGAPLIEKKQRFCQSCGVRLEKLT